MKRTLLRGALALACTLMTPLALAQWAPTKPVRIVVPFPAGGIVDLMSRSFTDRLSAALGQPVVIEVRPGAHSSLGNEVVARADPDGHTLLMGTLSMATLPPFMKVPWHPTRDFAGVAMVGQVPNLVVTPATLEPKTLREFVAYAKARPGQLNFANGGNGTSPTLGVELLRKHTGMQLTSVGYKGFPPVIPDMIAGRIEFSMVPFAVAAPHVKSGKLRALAIASNSRSRLLPDVPTMAEAGFADSPVISWYAIFAPAGTPKPVIQRLNAEFARALADPEVQGRIEALGGATLPAGTPAEVDTMLAAETDRWAKFIKESGLKLE